MESMERERERERLVGFVILACRCAWDTQPLSFLSLSGRVCVP